MKGSKLAARNDLIEQYREYAQNIVGWMIKTMHLPRESFDDLLSASYMGLVEAAERFDAEAGYEFRAYAYFRIRGAVIDSIRQSSQLSGRAYNLAKAVQAAQDLREQLLAERDSNSSASKAGEKKEAELERILDYAAGSVLAYRLSFNDAEEELGSLSDEQPDPEMQLLLKQSGELLQELVETLSPKERTVIKEFYFRDKTFKEIVEEQDGMSKSWVSRLHTKAIKNLKQRFLERTAAL